MMRHSLGHLALFLGLLSTACGGSSHYGKAGGAPSAPAESRSGYAAAEPGMAQGPAPAAAMEESAGDSALEGEVSRSERPGLATSWGENHWSQVRSVHFEREDADSPQAVASLFYNDADGVRAMSGQGFVGGSESVVSIAGGAFTVSLEDEYGRPLPAVRRGGRTYAVGDAGSRYQIRIDNHTSFRIEAVATVDGLDVIDGEDGDFAKRGYLVKPHDSLEIEGFRRSEEEVAVFRFGSVDDSYAAQRGKGRDVGVIGVAFFRERGSDWRWTPEEVRRRETADPFPARFAPPPRGW